MQIRPNICPYGHTANRALDSLPRNEETPVAPKDDGKFTIDDIICPFQRAAYNEGALEVDENGVATNLPEVLREFAGASWALTGVANHAAKKLTTGGDWSALWADSYNVQDLEGSSLDHKADSQILRGGFNQERLDRALSFSSDGERMTLEDMRRFQKANLAEEPGKRDEVIGAAEFSLLVKIFGRSDAMGTKFIRNKDLVRLYKEAKWPEDWEPPKPGSVNFISTGLAVKEYFAADSGAGVEEVANLAESQQSEKKGKASCPFLTGQPYDMGEAAKQHSDKLA